MAMISAGDLDSVRPLIEHNVRVLGEFAREGLPVLCTDPSAALCLSQEYPNLTDHPDQAVLSEAAIEATAFLAQLMDQGKLKQGFQPIEMKAVYHTPCHVKALGAVPAVSKLLALIPGLELHSIEKGCSGMAGAFGLTSQHFETSMQIGTPLFDHIREQRFQLGVSQCSSCRMQIEQGTAIAAIHPVKLLALAYGLMPEIRSRLEPSRNPLLTT
jgi:Fe-S oxidoreductase